MTENNYVTFQVLGVPVAKGRPKFAKRGNFVSTYTPQKTINAERSILSQALPCQRVDMPWEGAIKIEIVAVFPIPASYSKKRRQAIIDGLELHVKKPDADNIGKTFLDSLNEVFFIDDAQVVDLHIKKIYGDVPKTIITIWKIE